MILWFFCSSVHEKTTASRLEHKRVTIDRKPTFFNTLQKENSSNNRFIRIAIVLPRGVLDICLGGEVRRGPSYTDPV